MKIVFMGTPRAAVPSLERIFRDGHEVVAVYTQPDRPSGRGNKIMFSPVKKFALAHDLPIFQPIKIRTQEALEIFRSHNADVTVVVAYGRILPDGFIQAFPKGAINVHFSLLPKYRGAAPVNWVIVNGESVTGVTTMQMDTGLDTGSILLQKKTEIGENKNAVELMERLEILGADALSETLERLDAIKPAPQNDSIATFAPILKKEDGLIDWSMTATEIANRVRGFQPFPTAFTYYKQHRQTMWKVKAVTGTEFHFSTNGEILEAKGDSFLIGCGGETVLAIEELQPEGKRRMSARDFLNGVKPQPGDILG